MTARPTIAAQIARHGILMTGAAVVVFPFVWMLATSLKPPDEIFAAGVSPIPQRLALVENYGKALFDVPLPRFLLNGVLVTGSILAAQLVVMLPAAYALARLRFRGRELFFGAVVAGLLIPPQVPAIPVYIMLFHAGLLDTYAALILPSMVSVFGIFLLRQFFKTVPQDLIDAARLDGFSELAIVWRLMVPLALPAIGAFAVFSVVVHWNDFFWPLVVISSVELATPPLGIAFFRNEEAGSDVGALMAAAVLVTAPLVAGFLIAQRRVMEGLTLQGFLK